jgi:hypothetical protein
MRFQSAGFRDCKAAGVGEGGWQPLQWAITRRPLHAALMFAVLQLQVGCSARQPVPATAWAIS